MRLLLPLLLLCSCAVKPAPIAPPPPPLDTIEAVAQDYWEVLLAESPLWATQLGDRRFDALLPTVSSRAHQETQRKKEELQRRLQALNAGYMRGEQLLTARVLAVLLRDDLAHNVCATELWSVDQLGGLQLWFADLATYQQVDSPSAAAAYVSRLHGAGMLFEQHIDNLRQGLQRQLTSPRIIVERVIAQLHELTAVAPDRAPYLAVLDRATALSPTEHGQLRQDIIAATQTSLLPALRTYQTFLEKEYLPHARASVGLSVHSDGEACYQALSLEHGGRSIRPAEWHSMGMAELQRLRQQMGEIARQAGFASPEQFATALANNNQQITHDPNVLVEHATVLLQRAQKALPGAFVGWPQAPVLVRAVEAFREKAQPAGFYEPAATDGSHAAVYYINTYKPETRPFYNLEALTFHEAIPGHHLQIAWAATLAGLPKARRHLGATAYVEGWGLYAEMLADEMGLYSDSAARFGMLNFQAWRATRLIVDSGLHAMGWTRDQAIDFMTRNVALPQQDIVNEVDRYIVWPGQALAYMSGRMELQALRTQAKQKQGIAFRLDEFHQQVLTHGALPLPVLRDVLGVWINTAQPAG